MDQHQIRLLSDTVANQIAAGEVVQRPASVVKELLENAVDAGADHIQLIIKDAGKLLVQVIDNGCGMNEVDARMSFERHATSKISNADDLFHIRTMGFRGEALASIASVAQVEMKTRQHDHDVGILIRIEGNQVTAQDVCQCSQGTSIAVKNLFYNVPARRNFLKSNTIEIRHIYDEFHRVALAFPEISMTFTENNEVKFKLDKANLKQRIVQIFGSSFQKKIIQVDQETEYLKVKGFLVKPEFAKKTRGEQFLFVNKRFIKNFFMHRIIADTFRGYISSDMHPGYFLFFSISPEEIDVNVHPTKTEIKFRNEHNLALILESSLKYAIGSFNVAPSIDFEIEQSIDLPLFDPKRPVKIPGITINPNYNPFQPNQFGKSNPSQFIGSTEIIHPHSSGEENIETSHTSSNELFNQTDDETVSLPNFLYAAGRYIITAIKSGIMIVDVCAAQERMMYNQVLSKLNEAGNADSQQLLYPETFDLQAAESDILLEIIPELDSIGFNVSHMGKQSFSCSAIPADWDTQTEIVPFLEHLIETYQFHLLDAKKEKNIALALSLSRKIASKPVQFLSQEDINIFIDRLFGTPMPELTPTGNKVFRVIDYHELQKSFLK